MNDNNSRARGVIVYDMTDLELVNGPTIFGEYALMVRRDDAGEIIPDAVRMVHTEGVAYLVTNDQPWGWTDYAPCEKFTPAELIILADADKAVDLADWIRTHNARLESNFHAAWGWATNAEWAR